MMHDLVDEAIAAHHVLEQTLERAAVASACDAHRRVQRFISSHIIADSMKEFPAIVHSLKTGNAFDDDLQSEILHLGAITEEDYLRWFRHAMRHAYAGDAAGVDRASRQALIHMERCSSRVSESIRFIGSFYGKTEEENMRKIRKAGEGLVDYLDATMYLRNEPTCSQHYVIRLCDAIQDAFDDLDRPAIALAHVRELAYAFDDDGTLNGDFLRFSDRCFARINSHPRPDQ